MNTFCILFLIGISQVRGIFAVGSDPKVKIDFYNTNIRVPDKEFSAEEFLNHACSACFVNMPPSAFKNEQRNLKYDPDTGLLMDVNNKTYNSGASYSNASSDLYQTFKEHTVLFWVECCQSAENCWHSTPKMNSSLSKCSPVWDGLQCWKGTEEITQECPQFYTGFIAQKPSNCPRYVKRRCNDDGNWQRTQNKCEPYEFYRNESGDNPQDEEKCCRVALGVQLSYKAFHLHSCAQCYKYLLQSEKFHQMTHDEKKGVLVNNTDKSTFYYADLDGDTTALENNLKIKEAVISWKDCCRQAVECCDIMLKRKHPGDSKDSCPQTWDGWSCIDYTKSGTVFHRECPDHVYVVSKRPNCLRDLKRTCENNSEWYVLPSGDEWTDYNDCGNDENEIVQQTYSMSWYAVSFTFLVVALFPFFLFRQLHVHRITIHKNLFIAMAMLCFFSILELRIVIIGSLSQSNTVLKDNGAGCKIQTILLRYFVMASHFWMLCEGIYLHQVITAAFKDQKNLKIFYLIGWGIPVIPVSIYAILMKVSEEKFCWTLVKDYRIWILSGPSMLCLLLNLIFLGNIIRVLVTKLRSVQSSEPTYFRKALRAALFLIPLLGLHQLVQMVNPDFSRYTCSQRRAYVMFQKTVNGMEGMLVSFLFCFLNGEVLHLVKLSLQKFKASHGLPAIRSRLSFSTQISTVMPHDTKRVAETQH